MANEVYKVNKGDCAWNVAKSLLSAKGEGAVKNADIIKEMNRLAVLNNCENVEDFGRKFFMKIGTNIKIFDDNKTNTTRFQLPETQLPAEVQDTTAPKSARMAQILQAPVKISGKTWEQIQSEQAEINKLPTDKERVVQWHKQTNDKNPGNYVIVDKKACQAIVYSSDGDVLQTFEVGLGKEKGDGLLRRSKQNPENDIEMTSAGIYTINYKGTGRDAYARLYNKNIYTMTTDRGETGVALHQVPNGNHGRRQLFNNGNLEDNRMSNGCVNFLPKDFKELEKYVKNGTGTKVYVLPEEDNNYIMVKNGTLNLVQKEFTKNVFTSVQSNDSIPIQIHASTRTIPKGNEFAQALAKNKEALMKELSIDNDTYNSLANLSLGIAGQESKYGESTQYWWKENCQRLVNLGKLITGNNSVNSRGLTQMKINSYTDSQTKKLFKNLDITEENLNNPEKSAIATMIVLGCMYKNELPALKTKMAELDVTKEEAILYLWQGKKHEITGSTATPKKNIYIENVMKFAKDNFTIYQDNA